MSETNERQTVRELAEQSGWQRRELDRIDIYKKGERGVEVIFTEGKLSGGTLFEYLKMLTHTREMTTVQGWLAR